MLIQKLLVGVVSVCACAAYASAPGTKVTEFSPYGGGIGVNDNVDGVAIINFDAHIQGSRVHLHAEGLLPGEVYGVAFIGTNSGDFDGPSNPFAFTANPAGSGTYDVSMPTVDLGPSPTVYIYVWNGSSDFGTSNTGSGGLTEVEYRAMGTVP